ncbi:MAG: hypothetical protein ACLUD2_17590 [Clostridium sp.]
MEQANSKVNQAALGLTLHRQTIASFPNFSYSGKNPDSGVRRRAGIPRYQSSGGKPLPCPLRQRLLCLPLSSLTFVVTSLLESHAAAERIFKIEDAELETREPEQFPAVRSRPSSLGM